MATLHNLFTISHQEPVQISPTGNGIGRDVTYQNVSPSGYIYIGGNGVSDTNYGYRLMPNHSISFELEEQDELYAIASAPGSQLAYISINLEKN